MLSFTFPVSANPFAGSPGFPGNHDCGGHDVTVRERSQVHLFLRKLQVSLSLSVVVFGRRIVLVDRGRASLVIGDQLGRPQSCGIRPCNAQSHDPGQDAKPRPRGEDLREDGRDER